MTSKKNNRGSVILLGLALGFIALLIGFSLMRSSMTNLALSKKGAQDAKVNNTLHTVAALYKQELNANFDRFKDVANTEFDTCRGNEPVDLLKAMKDQTCPNAKLQLTYFKVDGSTPNAILMSELKTKKLKLITPVNQFDATIIHTDYNVNRKHSIGQIELTSSAKGLPTNKNVQMVVDVERTLNYPPPRAITSRLCRAVPGSVCHEEQEVITESGKLTYLESGTGRIMLSEFDRALKQHKPSPKKKNAYVDCTPTPNDCEEADPKVVSVKNLDTTRTNYLLASFCINAPGFTPCPQQYVIDAATDTEGDFFLTADGRILDQAGVEKHKDPKIVSIAFDNKGYYLRSDGQIFEGDSGKTLKDIADFKAVDGYVIPNAEKLVMGKGPAANP